MANLEEQELRQIIRRLALINAVSFQGKASEKPVMGKLLAERPNLKTRIKEMTPMISEIVREVNELQLSRQRSIVLENWPEALRKERREDKKVLPPLPNVERFKQVVTRFAPNPDCVLHLGNARAIILSHEYAKMYNGCFILRFEDTDPRLKRSALQFVQSIRSDLLWLGCEWNAEYIQSDRLPIYYHHAEKLLRDRYAYVCTCSVKDFQSYTLKMSPCPCRDSLPEDNVKRWRSMLDGTCKEGEAVLRIKTDLSHPNPAVREWPAFRIIDPSRYPHPRTGDKYRVWPLYNFAAAIDDHLMEVTHIIRGKEHLTNQRRQEYLYRYLGWEYPEAIHYGRLKIVGASLSKSKIVRGVQDGTYKGWDDPRLATFMALRRRGIKAEAIRRLIVEIGPRPPDITVSWENLYAYNRKLIDATSSRFFFVQDPILLVVDDVPKATTARIPFHPDQQQRGFRHLKVDLMDGKAFALISRKDSEVIKSNRIVRLIELFNFEVEAIEENKVLSSFHSYSYEEGRSLNAPLIHWIPADTGVSCNVIMPDGSTLSGVVEDGIKEVKPDEIVQFERFGFVRIDEIGEKIASYFAHR